MELKNCILRSMINFDNTKEKEHVLAFLNNFSYLEQRQIPIKGDKESSIYAIIAENIDRYNSCPNEIVVRDSLSTKDDLEGLEYLDEIKKEFPRVNDEFKSIVSKYDEKLKRDDLHNVLKLAAKINSSFLTEKGKTYKGPVDAVNYLFAHGGKFLENESDRKHLSLLTESTDEINDDYLNSKIDKTAAWGVLTGMRTIDMAIKGASKKELIIVAGSTGEMKTTFCLNWAYYGAMMQGYNILFMTLEMSREQIEKMLVVIHSANERMWTTDKDWGDIFPLSYDKVMDGNLDDDEEEFFTFLLNDLKNKGSDPDKPYGEIIVWDPPYTVTPTLLRREAELQNKRLENGLHMIIPDYPDLMGPDGGFKSNDGKTSSLNRIIRDLKIISTQFNNGEGIAIVSPFQINREGKKDAVKREEKDADKDTGAGAPMGELKTMYNSFHLSYANEAERSATAIIYTYLNENLRDTGYLHIGCIKNRHGSIFPPFLARVYFESRRVCFEKTKHVDKKTEYVSLEDIGLGA